MKSLATTANTAPAAYRDTTPDTAPNRVPAVTATSLLMSAVLIGALVLQFRQKRYEPWSYWLAVVLISIVGTLISDNLVDNFGVTLMTTTIVFSGLLAATFITWYASERTLSIHEVTTTRREGFYWLAILFTFALGTAAGDLVSEKFALGYMATGILFGMIITSITFGYYVLKLDGVWAFWIAYIFTRPLGASFGDLMSQPHQYGGMGFGTIITSAIFLGVIVVIVAYLSATHKDRIETTPEQ